MKVKDTAGVLPEKFTEWEADWAEKYRKMSTNPWTSGVLPVKLIELICIALQSSSTNLNADGTRRHIRAALVRAQPAKKF